MNVRVAIVGAGPSGLAAAERALDAGFSVTVIERSSEAGGKVKTVRIGDQLVDVGAICGTRRVGPFGNDYDPIFALSDRYGIRTRRFTHAITYDVDRGTHHFGVRLRDALAAAAPLARYLWAHRFRWRGHQGGEIGDDLSAELTQPWSKLLDSTRTAPMASAFQTLLTSAGYAPDLAAYHQASYFDPGLIASVLLRRGVETWVGGYQEVFRRFQRELAERGAAFHFDRAVTSIRRTHAPGARPRLSIATDRGSLEADEVMIACDVGPLLAAQVLDVRDDTRAILDRLHTAVDYRTVVCRIRGLPDHGRLSIGHVPRNCGRGGQPVLYCQQQPGLYVWYVEGTDPETGEHFPRERVEAILQDTIPRLASGAVLERIEHYAEWRYAPHASAEDVRDGVLHRLKRKQGEDGYTFLLAAASFETTARVMQNARDVVDRIAPMLRDRAQRQRHSSGMHASRTV